MFTNEMASFVYVFWGLLMLSMEFVHRLCVAIMMLL